MFMTEMVVCMLTNLANIKVLQTILANIIQILQTTGLWTKMTLKGSYVDLYTLLFLV